MSIEIEGIKVESHLVKLRNHQNSNEEKILSSHLLRGMKKLSEYDIKKAFDILFKNYAKKDLENRKLKHIINQMFSNEKVRLKYDDIYNFDKEEQAISIDKDKFHKSTKWLKTRYEFLRLSSSKMCSICKSDKNLQVDHILPISIYPELAFDKKNLRVLCRECNIGKGNNISSPRTILRKKIKKAENISTRSLEL